MSGGRCPVVGCTSNCKPNQLMCKTHWFELPKEIRDRVWKYYRNGDKEKHGQAMLDAYRFHAQRTPII